VCDKVGNREARSKFSHAFEGCVSLRSVAIPTNITLIDESTFTGCSSLADIVIPNGVTNIGGYAFGLCSSLTHVEIPDSVKEVTWYSFGGCTNLTSVTVGKGVDFIGDGVFSSCRNLSSVNFWRNRPRVAGEMVPVFVGSTPTVYYLPGTTGWESTFARRPALLRNPTIDVTSPSFGVQEDGFGFTVTGTANIPIVIEAASDLTNPVWIPVLTNVLTAGSQDFADPEWTNSPSRLYRIRSP
jgi:hypothetical protein